MGTISTKAKEFYHSVDDLVWKYDMKYIDAVVMHCEKNNIEIENIIPLIKNNDLLKSKIEIEAENLNFIPKKIRLDI